jgi:four helix bundle protein
MYKEEPYKKLLLWKMLSDLRREIFTETEKFKVGNFRLVEQMRAAARSGKQNFAEGYRKKSLGHFINFCNISRASLEELNEDIKDCFDDKLISQETYGRLSK